MKVRGRLLHKRWKEMSVVRPLRKVGQGGKQGRPGRGFPYSLGPGALCGWLLGGNLPSDRDRGQKDEMKNAKIATFRFPPIARA